MMFNDLVDYASQYGLVTRGGFAVTGQDNVPDIGTDAARSLVLFGNAGSSLWKCFAASAEYADGEPHPLNRWSERIGNQTADRFGGLALFPFGEPPYRPFLQWASRSEALHPSKLGMLIHPQYGLWHAYRFAVAFPNVPDGMVESAIGAGQDICATCPDQPCLDSCPVGAFDGQHYDVGRCYSYLKADRQNSCSNRGCTARLACPQGLQFRYRPGHARFHMAAFYTSMAARFGG